MALAGISSKLRSVLQLKTLLPASSTAIPLLAVDSLALHPCILLPSSESEPTPELDSVAERLANGTGAHLILARPHEPNDARLLDHLALLAHHLKLSPDETSTMRGRQRKVGGFGIGANASLMLDLASVIQSDPLRATAVVDPPIQQESLLQWSNIPIKTPLQAHLGTKEAAHAHWASALDSRWQLSILTHGGFHSHGLHSAEERVYTYPEMASGNFEKKEESRERMIGIIWARIFTFFRMHLKEL